LCCKSSGEAKEADLGIVGACGEGLLLKIYAHMTANMEEKASQQFSKLMKDLLL
jgi:4-hydroxy-3-methylbut-2-en-1-yl diphosphate synthase IspG/GcpE